MPGDPESRPLPTDPGILNGWKEIAAYFRKGVRTVQRWESELEMPVHRMAGNKGEVIYALVSELDEWRQRQERRNGAADDLRAPTSNSAIAAPEPGVSPPTTGHLSPRRRGWRPWLIIALGACGLAAIGAAWFVLGRNPLSSQPARLRVDHEVLFALNADGEVLWHAQLPYPPASPELLQAAETGSRHHWLIEDLDGDGRREVLVRIANERNDVGDLVCFEWNGKERWRRRPVEQELEFGEGRMGAPWIPLFFVVLRSPDNRATLWAAWANAPDFGSFVERLDTATGRPLAEFWSAGHVTDVASGSIGGRDVLFVGAANNELRGASLAVYDAASVAASAPAMDRKYACVSCPTERPLAFFVFPKTRLGREVQSATGTLYVSNIMQDANGQVKVIIDHGRRGEGEGATVLYRFDSQLRLVGGETLPDYQLYHRRLEREGRLAQPFGPDEEKALFPVRAWDGEKYIDLVPPASR